MRLESFHRVCVCVRVLCFGRPNKSRHRLYRSIYTEPPEKKKKLFNFSAIIHICKNKHKYEAKTYLHIRVSFVHICS